MKHRLTRILTAFAGVLVFLAVGSVAAEASPLLRFKTGTGFTFTITDNGFFDLDPTVGVIKFDGSIDVGPQRWYASLTIGQSYPTLGGPTNPWLNLQTVQIGNSSIGSLNIQFTDTFDLNAVTSLVGDAIGASQGIVNYNVYADTAAFGHQLNVFGSQLTTGPSAFNQIYSQALDPTLLSGWTPAQDVWLTQEIDIVHNGAGENTVGSFDVISVPEPTTLLLLGAGLIGVAVAKRRNNKA